jgi:uncharacterized protein
MLLIRLVLLLLIGFFAYRLYRLLSRPRKSGRDERTLTEDMVRCTECGVHVPRTRALPGHGTWFCCEQHHLQHDERTSDT